MFFSFLFAALVANKVIISRVDKNRDICNKNRDIFNKNSEK